MHLRRSRSLDLGQRCSVYLRRTWRAACVVDDATRAQRFNITAGAEAEAAARSAREILADESGELRLGRAVPDDSARAQLLSNLQENAAARQASGFQEWDTLVAKPLQEGGINPRHARAMASQLEEGQVLAVRARNIAAVQYDDLGFTAKPEGYKLRLPDGTPVSPKSSQFNGLVPKNGYHTKFGKSVMELTSDDIRRIPIDELRQNFHISDIDLAVIIENQRVVPAAEVGSSWIETLNKAIRGREPIQKALIPSGPEGVYVEPTDYVQHPTWSTWTGNKGKVPPGGAFVFDYSGSELRTYSVPEIKYNDWLSTKVAPENLRPYGWPWQVGGR